MIENNRNKREHNRFPQSLDALLETPRETRNYFVQDPNQFKGHNNPMEERQSQKIQAPGYSPTTFGNLRKDKLYENVLDERFDFSGHNGESPHVNYGVKGSQNRSILGDCHNMPLPGFDNNDNIGSPKLVNPAVVNNNYQKWMNNRPDKDICNNCKW